MPKKLHQENVFLGCLAMLASTVMFAVMHASVRYLSAELHPFEIAFFRNALALLFFIPLVAKNQGSLLKTEHFKWHFLRASLNVTAMLIFFYALSITPLAVVQALSFTAPLFTTVLAIFVLGERVRLRRWAAIILGFTGVLIILRPGVQPIELGTLLVLCSGVCNHLSHNHVARSGPTGMENPNWNAMGMVIFCSHYRNFGATLSC